MFSQFVSFFVDSLESNLFHIDPMSFQDQPLRGSRSWGWDIRCHWWCCVCHLGARLGRGSSRVFQGHQQQRLPPVLLLRNFSLLLVLRISAAAAGLARSAGVVLEPSPAGATAGREVCCNRGILGALFLSLPQPELAPPTAVPKQMCLRECSDTAWEDSAWAIFAQDAVELRSGSELALQGQG